MGPGDCRITTHKHGPSLASALPASSSDDISLFFLFFFFLSFSFFFLLFFLFFSVPFLFFLFFLVSVVFYPFHPFLVFFFLCILSLPFFLSFFPIFFLSFSPLLPPFLFFFFFFPFPPRTVQIHRMMLKTVRRSTGRVSTDCLPAIIPHCHRTSLDDCHHALHCFPSPSARSPDTMQRISESATNESPNSASIHNL